jgi:uncharacterized protein YbjT (DUF2867 family)
MKVLITGATGFIGNRLIQNLLELPDSQIEKVIALRRSPTPPQGASDPRLEWRSCDLFSLIQTEKAVHGADIAVYLVHSMLPTARLNQSSFQDSDLILADNFARTCKQNGIQRILYLGGLIPETTTLSPHLQSRLEVEQALAAYGAQVITLRAGLILGTEGSSFQILSQLVRRLPLLICPHWTRTLTQPITVDDTLHIIRSVISNTDIPAGAYDIGGPDRVTYQELMQATAHALHLHRAFINIPFFTPGLSALWVQLITGASRNLITPLVQSLKHPMIAQNNQLQAWVPSPKTPLQEGLKVALAHLKPTLRSSTQSRLKLLRVKKEVRSIQRLPLPQAKRAEWVAQEYFRWLPRALAPLIRVQPISSKSTANATPRIWNFSFSFLPIPLLQLQEAPDRSSAERTLFRIVGGLLVAKDSSPSARLEFREVLGGKAILAAIHDFKPRLPWPLYQATQAVAHLWVMNRYREHLQLTDRKLRSTNPSS